MFCALFINGVLNYILIQWIGSNGAAIATVISLYVSTLLMLPVIASELKTSMRALFEWRFIWRIFVWSGLSALVVAAFRMTLPEIPVSLRLLVSGGVYAGVLLATRAYFQLPSIGDLLRFLRKQPAKSD